MQGNTRRRKMIKGIVAVVLLVAIHVKCKLGSFSCIAVYGT